MSKFKRKLSIFGDWLKYAWRIPVSVFFVWSVAFIQHVWVLKVAHLHPKMYIAPTLVGFVFGVFWSVIAYYRAHIKEQHRLMAHLAQDSHDVLALRTQENYIFLSPRIEDLTGYPSEVFLLTPNFWEQLVHPEDLAAWQTHQHRIWSESHTACLGLEFRLVTPMKGTFWVRHEAMCFQYEGEKVCRCVVRDISLERGLKEALDKLRRLDITTQLPNRTGLLECVHGQGHVPLSGIMLDVDNLKQINGRFNVEVGDAVLRTLAERMLLLEQEDNNIVCLARWVGDNFIIVLKKEMEEADAWLKQQLMDVLEEPVFYEKEAELVDIRIKHEKFLLAESEEDLAPNQVRQVLHKAYVRLHENSLG